MSSESKKVEEPAKSPHRQKRRNDFNLGKRIGGGAFGDVLKVQDKETKKFYAMKILKKSQIQREKKINYVKLERDCMTKLNHPNIIRLYLTFQDPSYLYYVIEYAERGDLQKMLNNLYSIDIPQTKIIMGQTLLALSHMHNRRIIHRDLKPENMLLNNNNVLKITDFGTAKMFNKEEPFYCQRGSFVGSADYVSPETLKETPVGPETDLWSFGCTLYQLICGVAPFHTDSNYTTFQLIESGKYEFPDYVPEDAKDLISKLLVNEPKKRIGSGEYDTGYPSIRNSPFFAGIDWDTLATQSIPELTSFTPSLEAAKKKTGFVVNANKKEVFTEGEVITKEGLVVHKRKGKEEKQRIMILTDTPRLLIANIEKTKIVKEISIATDTKVNIEGNTLTISSSSLDARVVVLIDADDIQLWKAAIEDAIEALF